VSSFVMPSSPSLSPSILPSSSPDSGIRSEDEETTLLASREVPPAPLPHSDDIDEIDPNEGWNIESSSLLPQDDTGNVDYENPPLPPRPPSSSMRISAASTTEGYPSLIGNPERGTTNFVKRATTRRRDGPNRSNNNNTNRGDNNKSPEDEELIRMALHRNPYFTCLDEEQIETFVREVRLTTFRVGQAVILEGCLDEDEDDDDDDDNDQINKEAVHGPGGYDQSSISYPSGGTEVNTVKEQSRSPTHRDGSSFLMDDDYFDDEGISNDANDLFSLLESGPAGVDDEIDDLLEASSNTRRRHPHHQQQQQLQNTTVVEKNGRPTDLLPLPVPPMSGSKSHLYIVRRGNADVFYSAINPASLGPGTLFGEGGFLFRRPHSASIVSASDPLECFVMDYSTFVDKVLPSNNMKQLYRQLATKTATLSPVNDADEGVLDCASDSMNNEEGADDASFRMTMDDFLQSFQARETSGEIGDGGLMSIVNAYQSIVRIPTSSADSAHQQDPKTTYVSLQDFCFFHLVFARPDPEVDIAFLLMDRERTGSISRDDFERYLTTLPYFFNPHSEFTERHFGHGQTIRSHQFSQFLAELQKEMGRQAFLYRANPQLQQGGGSGNRTDHQGVHNPGFLSPNDFIDILKTTCGWRLPEGILNRLEALYCKQSIESAEMTAMTSVRAGAIKGDSPKDVADYSRRSVLADLERRRNKLGTRYFTYIDFVAFQDLLVQLPGICNLIERACQIKNGPISADDFKVASRVFGLGGRLSRQQVDIIFELFDLDRDGYITTEDAISVCGFDIGSKRLKAVEGRDGKFTFAPPPNYPKRRSTKPMHDLDEDQQLDEDQNDNQAIKKGTPSLDERLLDQFFQFSLSAIAGGFGIFLVYPLDLVKTRMMNQRNSHGGARLYINSFDCLGQVFRYERVQGLYRGLLPPLLAVGPEKFIKFTVNDLLRGVSSKEGSTSQHLLTEIVSGGCAGACQLLVTNPLEVAKIRMQMQGETARLFREKGFPVPKGLGLNYMTFSQVTADLGLSGLYKGAAACLLRDIPFGAIYFPTYAACLEYLVNRQDTPGHASAANILVAGTVAAIPASFLTTPMDFVKTRLQVVPRPGETVYTSIDDCIRSVYKTEGLTAFFRGSLFRVCRIAPQFGISLLGYEKLSQVIGFKGSAPPTNAPVDPNDYQTAFSPTSNAIESKAEDIDYLIKNMGLNSTHSRPPKPPLFPTR
jgi:Ca2+-binding EF-hand superfamily protein/CRP-like cAMP-binding protein